MSKAKARILIYGLLAFAAIVVWRLRSLRPFESGWPDVLSALPASVWPQGRSDDSIVASKYLAFLAVAGCLLLVALVAVWAVRFAGRGLSREE
jgi:hypothetical protein